MSRIDDYADFSHGNQFLAQLALDFMDSGFPGEIRIRRNTNQDILDLVIVRYQDCQELTVEEENGAQDDEDTFTPAYWTERLNLTRPKYNKPKQTGVKASELTNEDSPTDAGMGVDEPSTRDGERTRPERLRGVVDPDTGEHNG